MRKILGLCLLIVTAGACCSCGSKTDKAREQQIADSLRKDSIDSIQRVKDEEKLNEDKIAFLKSFYKNVIYPIDANEKTSEGYEKKFSQHLSAKVFKALKDYDDGIEDGVVDSREQGPKVFVFGDEGDYGDEGPVLNFEYLSDCWFKVTINRETVVKIRVESDKDDNENFIITGIKNPSYDLDIEP